MSDVTHCLNAIDQGDPHAASQLLPLVYDELRRLAARKLAHEKPGQTLDPTALVHEAYLRLVQAGKADAARAGDPAEDLLALHDALERFAAHDPLKAKLVELRFFAGLTLEQAAECLNISLSTADRGWRYARAWLYTAMAGGESEK